ncbi:MAG: NAD(P)-dependent oxidoreductase [Actinomycetota bacterium]|nr:NAD(P)-dependent oxidoreductase [Actinomycetota bacterium]
MRVFVAGATGVAGRRAVQSLVAAEHRVSAVARDSAKRRWLEEVGAAPVEVDLFEGDAVRSAVGGHDAVVNLTTKIPALARAALPRAWNENDRIRTHVSKNLVDAALATDAGSYIQESLAFMYPDSGDNWIDEDVPVDAPPHARTTLVAERQARRFSAAGGRGVVLRFGQFYAPDATHAESWVAVARRGLSPFPGPPDAFTPLVHADDVGRAIVAALEVPRGTYNVVDHEPLRQGRLAEILAAALRVQRLRFAPTPLMRAGGAKVQMLMRSQRVSNRRFREAAGWQPQFSSAADGFPQMVREVVART